MIKIILISVFSFLTISLFSQVVNIEEQRILCDTNGFYGGLHISSNTEKDKLSKFESSSGVSLSFKHNKHLWLNLTTYDIGKIGDTDYTNKFFNHSRYNYDFHNNVYVGELFFQIMMNDFLDVDHRTLVGGGCRLKIFNKNNTSLHIGILAMYEHEKLITNLIEDSFRSSDYLSFVYKVNKIFTIFNTIYYQTKFNDFTDYRIFYGITFELKMTDKLYFSILANCLYDEVPAAGIDKFTYVNQNKLSFKF